MNFTLRTIEEEKMISLLLFEKERIYFRKCSRLELYLRNGNAGVAYIWELAASLKKDTS